MRNVTKAVLAAGAIVIAGAAGFATFATADYGRDGGWKRGGHHGQHAGHHGKRGGKGHGMARLMERFDADKDGKLTQDELNQSRQALLAKFDADKDGNLNLKEFESLWLDFMHRRMVRGFQRIDVDGNASVTAEEFLKPYSDIVSRMDRNEDGVIDANDRKRKSYHKPDRDGEDGKDKERKG